MSLQYKFESLAGSFPRDLTPHHRRASSPFGKTWTEVQDLLERELKMLNYRRGTVILQTAHSPRDVRNDGQLRADVRKPEHPGVVIKFNINDAKTQIPVEMSFECDRFLDWKSNVRAIADAMEALRKVNRYGVSGGGKTKAHYEGFKALPPANDVSRLIETAAEFIAKHSNQIVSKHSIRSDRVTFENCYKQARRNLHPDTATGSHENFIELQKAKEILEKHFSNRNER